VTPEHGAAPASSAEVLSPDTLTVRLLKDAKTIDRVTASYLPAGNRGPRHKGMVGRPWWMKGGRAACALTRRVGFALVACPQITCDFKRRVITFTPDDKAIGRFTIQLRCVHHPLCVLALTYC
jgi:hypothetical protein